MPSYLGGAIVFYFQDFGANMVDKTILIRIESIECMVAQIQQMIAVEIPARIAGIKYGTALVLQELEALAVEANKGTTKARALAKRGMQEAAGVNRG